LGGHHVAADSSAHPDCTSQRTDAFVIAGLGPAFIRLKSLLRRLIDARAFQADQRSQINISTAFTHNLMGALCAGVMEYNSMYFGFAFLYLLALGFCFLAWSFSWKSASPIRAAALITPGNSVR
jgi:hypothetical protein